jgi:hypothetical protein
VDANERWPTSLVLVLVLLIVLVLEKAVEQEHDYEHEEDAAHAPQKKTARRFPRRRQ